MDGAQDGAGCLGKVFNPCEPSATCRQLRLAFAAVSVRLCHAWYAVIMFSCYVGGTHHDMSGIGLVAHADVASRDIIEMMMITQYFGAYVVVTRLSSPYNCCRHEHVRGSSALAGLIDCSTLQTTAGVTSSASLCLCVCEVELAAQTC